jgi:hypothetical protein
MVSDIICVHFFSFFWKNAIIPTMGTDSFFIFCTWAKSPKEFLMKRNVILAGILGMALVFGLVLAGCNNGTTDNGSSGGTKSLEITGITGITGSVTVALADEMSEDASFPAGGTATITGGTATIPLKTVSGQSFTTNNWTGTGDYYIFFWNASSPSGMPERFASDNGDKISFSGTVTTVEFSKFTELTGD